MPKTLLRFLRHGCGAFVIVATLPTLPAHTAVEPLRSDRPPQPTHPPADSNAPRARAAYLGLPMRFEPNLGRLDKEIDFLARGAGYTAYISGRATNLVLRGSATTEPLALTLRLARANRPAPGVGLRELPGWTNHLTGNDPRRWRTGIRGYAEVEYRDVYSGVNLVYYGTQQRLEYDFVVSPEADYRQIALIFDGADSVTLDARGNLIVATRHGDLVQQAPVIYQPMPDGTRRSVDGGYVIRGREVGFRVGSHHRDRPLVIDPILTYSTYLGGTSGDLALGLALDSSDNMYIAGETFSIDFPVINGAGPATGGYSYFQDAFVAKLNAAGDTLVYATYLGGHGPDGAADVAVDAAGNAYVVGSTFSEDFPLAGAIDSTLNGFSDTFVTKLDPSGKIVYSTFLGGKDQEIGYGVAIDAMGRAYVTGWTFSVDFPTVAPLQSSLGGSPAYRSADGGGSWSAIETGLDATWVRAFAIDPSRTSTIYAGTSADGLFKSTDRGEIWMHADAGLPHVPINALSIVPTDPPTVYAATDVGVYRTVDEGASWTELLAQAASSIAVDPASPTTIYVGVRSYASGVLESTDGGTTWSSTGLDDVPEALALSGSTLYAGTANGVHTRVSGGNWIRASSGLSGMVHALAADPLDATIVYAGTDEGVFRSTTGGQIWFQVMQGVPIVALALAPSNSDTVYVGGEFGVAATDDGGDTWRGAWTADSPVWGLAVDPGDAAILYAGSPGAMDAFVSVLNADGSGLDLSTYIGGSRFDSGTDLVLDTQGDVYLVGATSSSDFPVANGAQMTFGGVRDLFVVKLSVETGIAYATYLGATNWEDGGSIAVDGDGEAYIAGYTFSMDFPVVNAHQPVFGGHYDDFVTKLNASGNALTYSTFLGGSGQETEPSIAVTASGEAFVTGHTFSPNFPTVNPIGQTLSGSSDTFVSKLTSDGAVEYSTLIGGSGTDWARRIAVDSTGSAVVAGYTSSTDFPVRHALQSSNAGPTNTYDAVIFKLGAGDPDVTPPVTAIATSGTPGRDGWYRSSVVVTLSASDEEGGTGVANIEFSMNEAAFQHYTAPLTIATPGVTQLRARATDHAGNVENPAVARSVMIDAEPPSLSISSPQPTIYLHSDMLTFAFSATDPVSGVEPASPSAMLDGGPAGNGETIALLSLALGQHTVTALATDIAGNSRQRSVAFTVVATIDSLIATVDALAAQAKIDPAAQRSLLAKLKDAKDAFERGNLTVVRRKLNEVIDQANAMSGRSIAVDAAATLVADAEYVLASL